MATVANSTKSSFKRLRGSSRGFGGHYSMAIHLPCSQLIGLTVIYSLCTQKKRNPNFSTYI
ncbi:predicted protein [Histoplasma mississippiense (nom. inval.)]|uniref:predicted protein n=1 Tax=Ajellomyces capsulatus (strain NAm1 / WU24) TaxID=2059318 RepID=UPI000157CF18|nr:predicted protein [Histoplasma mississippiense (nom. inval.)]EDN11163.1 predicted protein [Histoplasma mississippiense (nom. inval.)]